MVFWDTIMINGFLQENYDLAGKILFQNSHPVSFIFEHICELDTIADNTILLLSFFQNILFQNEYVIQ